MEVDATRAVELLVGLPDVVVLGVDDEDGGELLVHVECRGARVFCDSRGIAARLIWRKLRFSCPDGGCPARSWTEEDARIGTPRIAMTDRAGR